MVKITRKIAWSSALLSSAFLGGAAAQSIGGNIIVPLLAQTVTPQAIQIANQVVSGSGVAVSGMVYPAYGVNNFWIATDNLDNAAFGGTVGLNVELDPQGLSSSGNKVALSGATWIKGAIKSGQAPSTLNFVGVQGLGQSSVNVGGTSTGSDAATKGAVFGGGFNAILANAAATNYLNVAGLEINTKITNGASTRKKSGIGLVPLVGDAAHGTAYDGAVSISNQNGGIGWTNGILFSDYNGAQPIDSAASGALIKTQGNATAPNGIDFTSYSFTGMPLAMPLMTPANSSATCTAGGIEWDTSFIYICTATNTWKRATLSAF